jgi:effector-binding domain-containing protein
MQHEPRIQNRAAQPYVAIPAHVTTEAEFRRAADSGFPELFGWLRQKGVQPAGPLFIHYLVLDKRDNPVEVELAVPVGAGVSGDARVRADVLPAGRWATLLHVGPYSHATVPDLSAARAALRTWMDEQGLPVDGRETDNGWTLRGCVEHFRIGPAEEPDYSRWETELAYLTASD